MRFRTKGTFETEAVIEIAQRLVAQLQDADVSRVSGVNIYLSTLDKKNVHRELLQDKKVVEIIELECDDLALEEKKGPLCLGNEQGLTSASKKRYSPRKRRA